MELTPPPPPQNPDQSSRNARYHCSICGRPFDRKDTLARHMQIHNSRRPPAKPRRKACSTCAQSKIRCDGEHPSCSSCKKRHFVCVYGKVAPIARADMASGSPKEGHMALDLSIVISPAADQSLFSPPNSLSAAAMSIDESQAMPPATRDPQFWLSEEGLSTSALDTFAQDLSWPVFSDRDLNSNLDWIFNDQLCDNSSQSSYLFAPDNSGSFRSVNDSSAMNPLITIPSLRYLDDSDHPNDEIISGLPVPELQEGARVDDPWPMEWYAQEVQRHIVLPALGVEEELISFRPPPYAVPGISASVRGTLQECIRRPFESSKSDSVDLMQFPSEETLKHCIGLYFAHFDNTLPIIHRPTFDPEKEPIVTLCLICIGVGYSNLTRAKAFSSVLSELIRRILVFMGEYDRRFVRTASYLTAQLLQANHGYHCGIERLFELSEASRSTLLHNARCMGLFKHEGQTSQRGQLSEEETWHEWIKRERLRRLGWAAFEYDSSVTYLHNNRAYLTTTDMNLNLPCSPEYWEAETYQAWEALHPWADSYPSTALLRSSLRSLFDETQNALEKITQEKQKLLITLMLLRMLWTCKEIAGSPLNDLVPNGLETGRDMLLRAVEDLTQSPITLAMHSTKKELNLAIYRVQLLHMAHLIGAGDLMNWLYPLLRNRDGSGNPRMRMLQWANEDSRRVRKVAYHSAQILALLRQYPNNMPAEPFLIFHAGIVLSCMSELLVEIGNPQTGRAISIDYLGASGDPRSAQVLDWIEEGRRNVVVSLHGIATLSGDAGRREVLDQTAELLKRRQVWGIAQNFRQVVLSLRDQPNRKPSSRST